MAFGGISDLSGTIKIEGEKISAEFLPAQPQAGQGTVVWNIPTPVEGCASVSSINSAYCGILILASRTPLNGTHIPSDGTRYIPDTTLDPELHAGDRIGDALVIGAFYEGEKKAAGEDLTTTLIVNDLDPDVTYFVGTYAVSCTLEYHKDGIRAYSDKYGDAETENQPSISAVVMNDGDGVQPTDGTELEAGREYGFEFDLNTNFPNDSNERNRITVQFDGADAQTYQDMLDTINSQLQEIDNPPRSAEPPNTGSNYWNSKTKQLQRFNGSGYDDVSDVIVNSADPSITPTGSYWFDAETKQLKRRNSNQPPSTDLWDVITTTINSGDPSKPECNQLWFDGINVFEWSGTAWCEVQTFYQPTNPSDMKMGECGQYWYNESTSSLNKYNIETNEWEEKLAIFWPDSPDSITSDTLWFSTTERVLRSRIEFGNISDWNLITTFVIGEVEPIPSENLYWFRESTNEIFKYTAGSFEVVDVLEWHEDPTSLTSCELWWDENSGILHEWDVVNLRWTEVKIFTESDNDPLMPEEIEAKSFWLDTENNILHEWDGSFYNPTFDYIDYPFDPTEISSNIAVAWYDPDTGIVQVPSDTVEGEWMIAEPMIISDYDPENIPVGKTWFDEAENSLKMWNGIAWINVPYTTQPLKNAVGDVWLDTVNNTLMGWDGKKWIPAEPKVVASIDDRGNIRFTTRAKGSCVALLMLVPGATWDRERSSPSPVTYGGGPMHASGYKNVYTENPFETPLYIDPTLREDQFLFNSLPANVQPVVVGSDTTDTVPAYQQLGVGTDGTPDERRQLAHAVRVQLGFGVVDVELTDEQLDTAIRRSLEELRMRSDIAYRRNFFLMDLRPGVQNYRLTNKKAGFNKIVTVMGAHRRSGAFSGGYSTNSVFDQLFAQQLYGSSTAGGFDMTSLYLSQQYLELIEMMFATKLNFHFNETSRTLHFHQDFHKNERVLLDTTIERTEQELLKDRWAKVWIERHTLGLARLNLAESRGKYGAYPGAGGGVSLNAADLLSQSAADLQYCEELLDNYISSNAEHFGAFDFVMG